MGLADCPKCWEPTIKGTCPSCGWSCDQDRLSQVRGEAQTLRARIAELEANLVAARKAWEKADADRDTLIEALEKIRNSMKDEANREKAIARAALAKVKENK